jgi:D-alanyl-D-alanine carboxypeptidase
MIKKRIFALLVIGGLLTAFLLSIGFAQTGISDSPKEFSAPAKTIIPENKALEASKNEAFDVTTAVRDNALLKNNLKWSFGSKAQTGWYIYVPLIQHLLETESLPESAEFAREVAKWQHKAKLEANGILDTKTLNKMVEFWQAQRLNRSDYPIDSELLTAPITDFYDPTRGVELLKIKRETYAAYKRMVAAALADKSLNLKSEGQFLKIVSAFRSREYQAQLRQKSPNSGRAGLAVNSPHFTGCALDIYVGGEPVTTRDDNRAIQVNTPVYKWLVKNAEKFGFYPYYYEPWHWEYRGCGKQ